MERERKQRVERATAALLRAVRELKRAKERPPQGTLPLESAPQEFRRAVEAFADAIAS